MRNTYLINENKRKILRNNAIEGVVQYSHYLVDKDFLIICEDGTEHILHFLKSDYRHLTGIDSNLDDNAFFENCENRHLDLGNIKEISKIQLGDFEIKVKKNCTDTLG